MRGNQPIDVYKRQADGPVVEAMTAEKAEGAAGLLLYTADLPATRPASDYTPRVLPRRPPGLLPLESTLILWKN